MQQIKRFGTFSGVFLPNVLTILGVILFYREGWLVGNAGLLPSILIIVMANLITLSTSLSMSAIVTNIRVKGGGAYFLVSRSLGPEIGGSIGVSLFFAQAFSIAFYIIGFTRSLVTLPFFNGIDPLILNLGTLAVLSILSFFSANLVIKAQYFIMGVLALALVSFFIGNMGFSLRPELVGEFSQGNFWFSFAIFFPAATGIFSGLSMSGDLKDPHKNLPRGTIASILLTAGIYLLVALFFAFNHSSAALLADEYLMQRTAIMPTLVLAGVFAATISSALGMILAAPRTLQALSVDGMAPGIFGKGFGSANEPRIALLLSVLLAAGLLFIGDLDLVSKILTMFFLASYGAVNLVAALEYLVGNPAYRPKFKVHWAVSAFGALGSFFAMFMIDAIATIIAIFLLALLYGAYERQNLKNNWGDIRQGFWASVIEFGLGNYHKYTEHPKNFRPHIAILEKQGRGSDALRSFASHLTGKYGIASSYVFSDLPEEGSQNLQIPYIKPKAIKNMTRSDASLLILQADGIGAFKNNTVLSDFYCDDNSLTEELKILPRYIELKKNVLLLKCDELFEKEKEDRIDIWLSRFTPNLSIMLLFPYLLTRNADWADSRIKMRMVVRNEEESVATRARLQTIFANSRINADAEVISLDTGASVKGKAGNRKIKKDRDKKNLFARLGDFFRELGHEPYSDIEREKIDEIILARSSDARLVVMGMRVPEIGKEKQYAEELKKLLLGLPLTVLVRGEENINLFK